MTDEDLWVAAGLTDKQIEAMRQDALGRGRRVAARHLGISPDSYRHRIELAMLKIERHLSK